MFDNTVTPRKHPYVWSRVIIDSLEGWDPLEDALPGLLTFFPLAGGRLGGYEGLYPGG